MHELWILLNRNADALQALAASVIVVLTIVTIVVLIATWRAARAQAAAAIQLTTATERQILILEQQVTMTKRQVEESVRPMLDIPVGASAAPTLLVIEIQNLGNGPALDITYAYARFGDRAIKEEFIVPPTVAKDRVFRFTIDPDRVRSEGLIFIYVSLSGNHYASALTAERPHFHYYPNADDWIYGIRTRSNS